MIRAFDNKIMAGVPGRSGLAALVAPAVRADDSGKKVVIPFDFVSKFDNGRLGEHGRRHGLEKARKREAGSSFRRSMADVRDYCKEQEIPPVAGHAHGRDEEDRQGGFRRPNRHLGQRRAGSRATARSTTW